MQRIPSIETLAEVLEKTSCRYDRKDTPLRPEGHGVVAGRARRVDVSVVTVCYNPLEAGRGEVFRKNLDSVQAQEDVCLEHLIIDGASTDGTVEWLREYDNVRHDIRILSQPDGGIYEAMNRGIALARGRYVIFLNTDDFFHDPHGMKCSLARLEESGCEFSFAPVRFSDSSIRHNPQLAPQRRLHRFLISWCFSHQSMLTSRSLLLRLDGFDTSFRLAADYDLLLRMIEAGAKGCFVRLTFTTFSTGGFSEENYDASVSECVTSLQSFFLKMYSIEMSREEAAYIFGHRVFPSKYLSLYKRIQKLVRERFVGIPKGPARWVSWKFNYIKYYLKCLNSNI